MLFRFILVAILCGLALAIPQSASTGLDSSDGTVPDSSTNEVIAPTAEPTISTDESSSGTPEAPTSGSADSSTSGSDDSSTSGSADASTSGSDDSSTSGSADASTSGSDDSSTSGSADSSTSGSDDSSTSGSDDSSTSGSSGASASGSSGITIDVSIEVALNANGCTEFVNYIHELGLDDLLNNRAPCTILAPSNAVIQAIKNLVIADIEFKKRLIKSLFLVGKHGLEELKQHVQRDQDALDDAIETLDGTNFDGTFYPSTGGLVCQGGYLTEAETQATNASILHTSNVCPQVQQTISDKLKSFGGMVSSLMSGIKNFIPSISNLFKNDGAQSTVIVPPPSVCNTILGKLMSGKISQAQSTLNSCIIPGKYTFEDFKQLAAAGGGIPTLGGQTVPVTVIDDNTIQVGQFRITYIPASTTQSNGAVYQAVPA